MLPARTEFEFLRSAKFRIRTVCLRGQISQGICFSLRLVGDGFCEGDDVTDLLGVSKYDPPVPSNLAGRVKGPFPSFLIKTDEVRFQATPCIAVDGKMVNGVLNRSRGQRFIATEKLDEQTREGIVVRSIMEALTRMLEGSVSR